MIEPRAGEDKLNRSYIDWAIRYWVVKDCIKSISVERILKHFWPLLKYCLKVYYKVIYV
jgi:hypothetical protein